MWTEYTSTSSCYIHTFVSEKLPTEQTLHALVRHAQDKGDLGCFKVEMNGQIITLTSEKEIDFSGFLLRLNSVRGDAFSVLWHATESVLVGQFKPGDDVVISGLISYGTNITGEKGRTCPFFMGRFKDGAKKPFLTYLEKELGIEIVDIDLTRHANSAHKNKVQLNNLMTIVVRGKVSSPGATNSLLYRSVGQRKSYGFGSLNCEYEVELDGEKTI
jgi:hypothetical protein